MQPSSPTLRGPGFSKPSGAIALAVPNNSNGNSSYKHYGSPRHTPSWPCIFCEFLGGSFGFSANDVASPEEPSLQGLLLSSCQRSSTDLATPQLTPSFSPSRQTRQAVFSLLLCPICQIRRAYEDRSSSLGVPSQSSGMPCSSRQRLQQSNTQAASLSRLASYRAL